MKAIHKKSGEVEVLFRNEMNVITILKDGEEHRVMPIFPLLFNEDGTQLDPEIVPFQEDRDYSLFRGAKGKKESRTAELIAGLAENRGERWNPKTRRYEKI